jgi:hypothetical protein
VVRWAIRQRIKRTEVELQIAKGHADHMRVNLDRQSRLIRSGATSQEDYETQSRQYGRAVLEVTRLEYLRESLKVAERYDK